MRAGILRRLWLQQLAEGDTGAMVIAQIYENVDCSNYRFAVSW